MKTPTPIVKAAKFVVVWQKARTFQEVLDQTGLTADTATCRASKYRRIGIPLKVFRTNLDKRLNIEELKALALESAEAA